MLEDKIKKEWVFIKLKDKDSSLTTAFVSNHTFYNFPDALVQTNPRKNADCYLINELKSTTINRKTYFYKYPVFVFFDIDLKSKKLLDEFIKMTGCNIEEFLIKLKTDKYVYISGHSSGGKGIRIIYMVINQYVYGEIPETYDSELLKHIHRCNYNYILNNYLTEKYGIKTFDGLDNAAATLTQPTFPIRKDGYHHINYNCLAFHHEVPDPTFEKRIITRNKSMVNETEFVAKIKKEVKSDVLKPLVEHYHFKVICMLSKASEATQNLFFRLYIRHYDGTTIPLPPSEDLPLDEMQLAFNVFLNFIEEKTRSADYFYTLEDVLIQYHIVIPELEDYNGYFENDCDCLFHKYDAQLNYVDYISDAIETLQPIIDQQKNIVLKAPAGAGKTKLCTGILKKDLDDKTNIFTAPKNSVLIQQAEIFGDDPCVLYNFTAPGIKPNWYKGTDGTIVLSSLKSLDRLYFANVKADTVVVDECHNLTFYSKLNEKPFVFPEYDKRINISATPEAYLIGEQDCYYVNLEKLGSKKTKADLFYTNHPIASALNRYFPNLKQLFLLNDKRIGLKLRDKMMQQHPDNIVHLVNSETKQEEESKYLMQHQKLRYNTYIVTEYISEGINILNEKWDDVIIIDNRTSNHFTFYQVSMRMRLAPKVNVLIFMNNCNTFNVPDFVAFKNEYALTLNQKFQQRLDHLQLVCDTINETPSGNRPYSKDQFFNQFFYEMDDGLYHVNNDIVKKWVFDEFYSKVRSNTYLNNLYLGYLFDLTVYRLKEDAPPVRKISREKINEYFIQYHLDMVQVKYYFGTTGAVPEEYEAHKQMYLDNQKYLDMLVERYLKLKDNEGTTVNLDMVVSKKVVYEQYLQKVIMGRIATRNADGMGKMDTLLKQYFVAINDIVNQFSARKDKFGNPCVDLMVVLQKIDGVIESTVYGKPSFDKKTLMRVLDGYGFNIKRSGSKYYVYPHNVTDMDWDAVDDFFFG